MNYATPTRPYAGNITDDPDVLLTLPYIPKWLLLYIPPEERPKQPTSNQRGAIRRRLRMRDGKNFNRCMGQSKRKVLQFEKAGDFSHSGWLRGTHGYEPSKRGEGFHKFKKRPKCDFCEACRCTFTAGWGTKGDFYGLGPETGTLGVGFCMHCITSLRLQPKIVLRIARQEVNAMQSYGDIAMDTEYALQEMRAETALAKQRNDMRQEMDVAYHALQELTQELVKKKRPQQRVQGQLVDVDDVTLLDMREKAVRMLDKLRLSDLKLDRTKFLQVDHVVQAAKEIEIAVRDAIDETRELSVKQTIGEEIETDRPVPEYVWDKFAERWAKIWVDLRGKAGMGVRQS